MLKIEYGAMCFRNNKNNILYTGSKSAVFINCSTGEAVAECMKCTRKLNHSNDKDNMVLYIEEHKHEL